MPVHSLQDVLGGLKDVQDTHMFDFFLPNVPGGTVGDVRDMAVSCQQAVYPGRSNEIMEVPLHGHVSHYRGRAMMPRVIQISYVENHKMAVTNTFQRWFEFQAGLMSGVSSGYKRDYALDGAVLTKYDITGRVADAAEFYGVQPEDMPDVQLDGSGTNPYLVTVSLRYDFYRIRNVRWRGR